MPPPYKLPARELDKHAPGLATVGLCGGLLLITASMFKLDTYALLLVGGIAFVLGGATTYILMALLASAVERLAQDKANDMMRNSPYQKK